MDVDPVVEKQEWFRRLSKDQQWDIIKSLLGYHLQIITTKMVTLASLSALSAAMVIVATLNKSVIDLQAGPAKVILSVLLFLIPASLLVFFLDVERGARGNRRHIEEYLGKIKTNSSFFDYVSSYFPFLVTIVYFVIVAYLLFVMWCQL